MINVKVFDLFQVVPRALPLYILTLERLLLTLDQSITISKQCVY